MAIEKPTQPQIFLLPPPDTEDKLWLQGHGGPRDEDKNNYDDTDDSSVLAIEALGGMDDGYYLKLAEAYGADNPLENEQDKHSAEAIGSLATGHGLTLIKGGKK